MSFLLGFQSALAPCPLTMNIAVLAYLSRSRNVFAAGLLFAAGQCLTYLGLTSAAFILIPADVTRWSAAYYQPVLGFIFILIGTVLCFPALLFTPHFNMHKLFETVSVRCGMMAPLLIGLLTAGAFCPVTAAFFLGMLASTFSPLSGLWYGCGAALPVVAASVLLAYSMQCCRIFFQWGTILERPLRYFTGTMFIIAGIW